MSELNASDVYETYHLTYEGDEDLNAYIARRMGWSIEQADIFIDAVEPEPEEGVYL